MTYQQKFKIALKEALSDTGLAFIVNVPLNFLLVYLCITVWQVGTFWTSVIMTSIFTVFAITRKTYVRLYFDDRNRKKYGDTQQKI
jgi:Na+-driven multidrug efflux pump